MRFSPIMTEREAHEMVWRFWGFMYGYPDCCIEEFCKEFDEPKHTGPWTGTGFVPCRACAERIAHKGWEAYVREIITPNRRMPNPFPKS